MNPTPPTIDAPERKKARNRVQKYIEAYEDAPNWGGPTIYPAPPSISDLRALLAASSGEREKALEEAARAIEAKRREWFCSGADCSNFDHGRDEGFEMALHIIRALAPTPATVEEL